MNTALEGGCQVPIGGFAEIEGGTLRMKGLVGSADGKTILTAQRDAPSYEPEALGRQIADDLLGQGADSILATINNG